MSMNYSAVISKEITLANKYRLRKVKLRKAIHELTGQTCTCTYEQLFEAMKSCQLKIDKESIKTLRKYFIARNNHVDYNEIINDMLKPVIDYQHNTEILLEFTPEKYGATNKSVDMNRSITTSTNPEDYFSLQHSGIQKLSPLLVKSSSKSTLLQNGKFKSGSGLSGEIQTLDFDTPVKKKNFLAEIESLNSNLITPKRANSLKNDRNSSIRRSRVDSTQPNSPNKLDNTEKLTFDIRKVLIKEYQQSNLDFQLVANLLMFLKKLNNHNNSKLYNSKQKWKKALKNVCPNPTDGTKKALENLYKAVISEDDNISIPKLEAILRMFKYYPIALKKDSNNSSQISRIINDSNSGSGLVNELFMILSQKLIKKFKSAIAAFKFFEINNTGRINFNEFKQACERLSLNFESTNLHLLFNFLETKHTGALEYNQFYELFKGVTIHDRNSIHLDDIAKFHLPKDESSSVYRYQIGKKNDLSFENIFAISPQINNNPIGRFKYIDCSVYSGADRRWINGVDLLDIPLEEIRRDFREENPDYNKLIQ